MSRHESKVWTWTMIIILLAVAPLLHTYFEWEVYFAIGGLALPLLTATGVMAFWDARDGTGFWRSFRSLQGFLHLGIASVSIAFGHYMVLIALGEMLGRPQDVFRLTNVTAVPYLLVALLGLGVGLAYAWVGPERETARTLRLVYLSGSIINALVLVWVIILDGDIEGFFVLPALYVLLPQILLVVLSLTRARPGALDVQTTDTG